MACILEAGKLTLSGYVGDDWFDDGFTYAQVLVALAQVEDDSDLVVHINSGGGMATEGAAIHSLLSARAGRTDVVIHGIAASAASLIAMAGETVTMALGSTMMVHDVSGFTIGTVADHEAQIVAMNALSNGYSRVYAAKTGKPAADCRTIMKAETWFEPEQAVADGFADIAANTGEKTPVAAFDYTIYARAPKELHALAREQNWRFTAKQQAAKPAATIAAKEIPVSDTKAAGAKPANPETPNEAALEAARKEAATAAVKADRDRRTAIMALDEAKGREALAEHFYATTDMDVDTIKAALAVAPAAAKVEDADPAAGYEASRTASGLGLGGQQPTPVASWKAAADKINSRR